MTVKKMSKILTFILVLAMVLGTVAMATEPSYTVSATDGSLEHGSITLTYNTAKEGSTGTATCTLNSTTKSKALPNDVKKVKVTFNAAPG